MKSKKMKSNTYELHNYADLNMDSSPSPSAAKKDSRKRKAASARGEKYSLRQKRQKRSASDEAEELLELDLELESLEPAASSRPNRKKSNSANKAKTKAAPLSKYRRKTANARERTRMREINTAFETLRHSVPQAITGEDAANASEKLTKITTLRLAMKYIQMLSDAIEDPSYEREFIGECLEESANREALISVDSEPELEVELPPVAATKKPTAKSKAGNKKSSAAGKRQTQKQAKQTHATPTVQTPLSASGSSGESCYAASSIGSPGSCAGAACSPSSAYASLSSSASNLSQRSSSQRSNSSPGLEPDGRDLLGLQGLTELDTLLLESDGESLHCLSPGGYEGLLSGGESLLPCRGDMAMPGCLDKPDVELSLRLLDADRSTDSFDFASDQQPSACISSLATLDGCYPFADLLPGDLSDMFLT